MDRKQTFERLVETLTSDERRQMLARISKSFQGASEPIYLAGVSARFDPEKEYRSLPWWQRLWVALVSIFRARPRDEIMSEFAMRATVESIRESAGDILDQRKRLLLVPFRDHIAGIGEAIPVIRDSFAAVSGPNRSSFVVYLAAMRIALEHRELMLLTDSDAIASRESTNEAAVKRQVRQELDKRMESIPIRSRSDMMMTVRVVDLLYSLTQFPFQTVLECFEAGGGNDVGLCSFDYVSRHLDSLATTVVALKDAIDPTALEAVILYAGSDTAKTMTGEELSRWVHVEMSKMTGALTRIRDHTRALELEKVLRVVHDDLSFEVAQAAGGEDWFLVYKRFLGERLTRGVAEHRIRRRFRELSVTAMHLFSHLLQPLPGYPGESDDKPVRFFWSAAVMSLFFQKLYDAMRPVLKAVLVQGEFYKPGNRAQFNDAYNELSNFGVQWGKVTTDLESGGALRGLIDGMHDAEQRRAVVEELENRVLAIRTALLRSVDMLSNLMHGILYAQPGSTFDSLSNFGEIGGRRNAELLEEMKGVAEQLASVRGLIVDLASVEEEAEALGAFVGNG